MLLPKAVQLFLIYFPSFLLQRWCCGLNGAIWPLFVQVAKHDTHVQVPLYALWMLEVCLRDQLGNEKKGVVEPIIRTKGSLD